MMNGMAVRRQLLAAGPWAFQDEDSNFGAASYSSGTYEDGGPTAAVKHRHLNKRKIRRAQAREARDREMQERVDHILEKVSRQGMHSLSYWEKRTLRKATEQQRQRDLELKEISKRMM
jgi:hypothetical protein